MPENGHREPTAERALIELALADAREVAASFTGVSGGSGLGLGLDAPPAGAFSGYELIGEIHRGGQGVVYQALQKATRRKVAIKVMREGPLADARDVARFEREVEVLGRLRHPNIVAIHDTGEAAGHSYYVMEYIPGRSLDAYLADGGPSRRDKLDLFATICEAVNAAHLRGVIHRDLKPGNIRVDESGRPRMLDFGLAKVATGGLIGDSMPQVMSFSGQFIGSLPWASPEQAEGAPDKIDTRSDVYSLGVILYQLLAGRFPYEMTGPSREVLDRIITAEPVPPSRVDGSIDDELETIVLKSLHKERDRRYQTAGELARDLRRYLAGDLIEAKRDSGWYVIRKTLRRHRLATAVAAGYLVLITVGAVALFGLYREAERQRALAQEAVQLVAPGVSAFVDRTVRDPFDRGAPSEHDLEQLVRVAEWIETNAREQPEVAAGLHTIVGLGFLKLQENERAGAHLGRALEFRRAVLVPPHPDLADALHNLGRALVFSDELDEAERCYQEALDMRRELFGRENFDVANSLNDLASTLRRKGRLAEAEDRFEEALHMRRRLLGDDSKWVAASRNNLAICLREQGRYDEAERLFAEALDQIRGFEAPDLYVVRGLRGVATCRAALGDCAAVERLIEEAIELSAGPTGGGAVQAARCRLVLAGCAADGGDLDRAGDLCREAAATLRSRYAGPHTIVAESERVMAMILRERGDLGGAARAIDEAIAINESILDAGHPDLARLWSDRAAILLASGDARDAADLCRQALAVLREPGRLVPSHPAVAEAEERLGEALIAMGETNEGRTHLRTALDALEARLGPDHPRTNTLRARLDSLPLR